MKAITRQLLWMAFIWCGSVLALFAVAFALRFLLKH